METLDPDKSVAPITQPPQVDTNRLFQKDPKPLASPAKKNPFTLLGKRKTLIILASIGVIMIGGGLVFANFGKTDNKQTSQESQGQQSESTSSEPDTETPAQTSTDQSATSPNNNTSTTTSGTTGGGGTGSTTPTPSSGGGTTTTAPKTYDISYTNSCYSPANITIKKGDTVKFANNSTKNMWPASNNHPSHTIYPEFDAKGDISPGGTYSFTFTKTGAWGYHDHSKLNCGGIITVQ